MTKIKGGYLERPVFSSKEGVNNVCDALNFKENDFTTFKKDTTETKNYTKIAPLFRFLINIKEKCLDNKGIIILRDVDDNHIFISENVTDDDKVIHIFKLTDKYQIKYEGEDEYKNIKKTIFTFDEFIDNNKKKVNDKYSLFDMKIAYDKEMILKIYEKCEEIKKPEFQNRNSVTIESMERFDKFMKKYCSPQKDNEGDIINIIYHENYNIINFMAFVNLMPELFELIELDYKHYDDYDDVSKICPNLDIDTKKQINKSYNSVKKYDINVDLYNDIYYDLHMLSKSNKKKIEMLEKRYEREKLEEPSKINNFEKECELEYIKRTENEKSDIIKKMQNKKRDEIKDIITKEQERIEKMFEKDGEERESKIKIETEKTREKVNKQTKKKEDDINLDLSKEEFEKKIKAELDENQVKEINLQKEFLKKMININEEILKNPTHICSLYDNGIKDKLYDEYDYNYIKKFRYAICLLSKIPNMKKNYDKITYACNYKEIGEKILSIDKLKKQKEKEGETSKITIKKQITEINNLINESYKYYEKKYHYFYFIVEIIEFLDDLHNIRKEFVSNNICLYNELIKLFVGQCYFNYLQEEKFAYLPFSIKSHSIRYSEISQSKDDIPDLFGQEEGVYNMPLIKQVTVKVRDYIFTSCGETNLLNFIKYILTDTSKKKITQENIDRLNDEYPNHKLKKIFYEELIKEKTDKIQTRLLQNKLNEFAIIMSNDTTINDLYSNSSVKCEINPSFENSMYILQKILGIETPKEGEIFIKELSDKFYKNYEVTSSSREIIDVVIYNKDNIKFKFSYGHGETEIINIKHYDGDIINTSSSNIMLKYNDDNFNTLFCLYNTIIYTDVIIKNNIISVDKLKYYLEFNNCFNFKILISFNEIISANIFKNTKIILFGKKFNQIIPDNAFPLCEKVVFGDEFNKEILANAFTNVKEIIFGNSYNQEIQENAFPSCLKVVFGKRFNQNIPVTSFRNVKEIIFEYSYNQEIQENAFPSCEKVVFGMKFNQNIPVTSFKNVKEITINNGNKEIKKDTYPPSCEKVIFGDDFDEEIPANAFTNVKEIIFGNEYNQEIQENAFPSCLKVVFGESFNQNIPASSFRNVKEIIFENAYNQPFYLDSFPFCEKVVFGFSFNQNIPASLFRNVKEIIFGYSYIQPINEGAFPECIIVTFGDNFNANIPASSFKSIQNINYHNRNQYVTINLYNNKLLPLKNYLLSSYPNLKMILNSELMKRLKENEKKTGGSIIYKQKYLKYKEKYLNLIKSFL